MKVHFSEIVARLEITITLLSDNGSKFVSGELKQWCEMRLKTMESPIYHQRANALAERVVQTVKRKVQAWSQN